jgi:hypothetical protein
VAGAEESRVLLCPLWAQFMTMVRGPDSVPAYVCTPLSRSSIQLNDLKGRASEKGKQRTTILGRNLLRLNTCDEKLLKELQVVAAESRIVEPFLV